MSAPTEELTFAFSNVPTKPAAVKSTPIVLEIVMVNVAELFVRMVEAAEECAAFERTLTVE